MLVGENAKGSLHHDPCGALVSGLFWEDKRGTSLWNLKNRRNVEYFRFASVSPCSSSIHLILISFLMCHQSHMAKHKGNILSIVLSPPGAKPKAPRCLKTRLSGSRGAFLYMAPLGQKDRVFTQKNIGKRKMDPSTYGVLRAFLVDLRSSYLLTSASVTEDREFALMKLIENMLEPRSQWISVLKPMI